MAAEEELCCSCHIKSGNAGAVDIHTCSQPTATFTALYHRRQSCTVSGPESSVPFVGRHACQQGCVQGLRQLSRTRKAGGAIGAAAGPHGTGATPAVSGTLHDRVEQAIDARSAVLPQMADAQRQQLAAAAQRTLVDILKTIFGKRDDTGGRRPEHPPLTENDVSSLQVRTFPRQPMAAFYLY